MSDLSERLRALSRDMLKLDLDMHLPEGSIDPDDAADRIEALERENAALMEANRKLHRRCQQAERVHAMTVGYLSNWLDCLKERAGKKRPDRVLFRWAIQDLHRKANLASRALPSDAKERKE